MHLRRARSSTSCGPQPRPTRKHLPSTTATPHCRTRSCSTRSRSVRAGSVMPASAQVTASESGCRQVRVRCTSRSCRSSRRAPPTFPSTPTIRKSAPSWCSARRR
ncbi:hypothetical protein QV65_03165 [Rhodococcus erythropolis]|nr:hypothetical protein QV65_03165 [Rhodococcus erythropolis]